MYKAKYFAGEEFECKCCGEVPECGMDDNLLMILDDIREKIGEPLYIESGYRCRSHNEEVGGVADSQHIHGRAADVYAENASVLKIAALAEAAGADGIGLYDDFVHIDVRGYSARWCGGSW